MSKQYLQKDESKEKDEGSSPPTSTGDAELCGVRTRYSSPRTPPTSHRSTSPMPPPVPTYTGRGYGRVLVNHVTIRNIVGEVLTTFKASQNEDISTSGSFAVAYMHSRMHSK